MFHTLHCLCAMLMRISDGASAHVPDNNCSKNNLATYFVLEKYGSFSVQICLSDISARWKY